MYRYIPSAFLTVVILINGCSTKNSGETAGADSADLVEEEARSRDYEEIGGKLMEEERIGFLHLNANNFFAEKVLGPALSETAPIVWEADGEKHKTATYREGVTLDMIEKDSIEYIIWSIRVDPPSSLETKRGIKIGSTFGEVVKTYNEAIPQPITDSTYLVAGSLYGGLMFRFENGKVVQILLGAAAE